MNHANNATAYSHWAILAGLRFFLSVVVVAGHFVLLVRPDPYQMFGGGYLNPLSAVYGFFILSGYSIAASLERENFGFYRRRFLRIWPLYLAAITFGMSMYFLAPNGFTWPIDGQRMPVPSGLTVIASLLMLQTIITGPIPTLGPIWSLAGEWWHYMISPILKRATNTMLLVWMLASFIYFLNLNGPQPGVAGMDQFLAGKAIVGLSWVWVTGFLYYRLRGTPFGFVILVAPSLFALTIQHSTGVPMFITAFVLVLSEGKQFSERVIAALNFLGDWSYPLYLFHIPALIVALSLGVNRSALQLGMAFAVSLAALYVVDYPSRKLFKKQPLSPKFSSE
ncbi:hypothetical protein C5O80_31460 [Burkholderia sp. SRS-46]|nr:hypothetical protein C5O80_31460 [Burkholderia sp. SRS-46]